MLKKRLRIGLCMFPLNGELCLGYTAFTSNLPYTGEPSFAQVATNKKKHENVVLVQVGWKSRISFCSKKHKPTKKPRSRARGRTISFQLKSAYRDSASPSSLHCVSWGCFFFFCFLFLATKQRQSKCGEEL